MWNRRRAANPAGGHYQRTHRGSARNSRLRVNRATVAAIALVLVAGGLTAVLAPLSFKSGQAPPRAVSLKHQQDAELAAMPVGSVGGGFSSLAAGGRVAQFQMSAHATARFKIAGRAGVPASGAGAVALLVHATGAASGSLTVWAEGARQPDVPSLRWSGHAPASGMAVSALGGGEVAIRCSASGPVTVTFYVAGYWLSGTAEAAGTFSPLAGGAVAHVKVAAGATVPVQVAGRAGVPGSGVGAVALAVDAAGRAAGSVNLYAAGAAPSQVPSVSWGAHAPGSGLVLLALDTAGRVAVRNNSRSPVTVTLDAVGYWRSGSAAAAGTFEPLDGAVVAHQRVGAHATAWVQVAGAADVPASGVSAAALSVEASGAASGSLEVWAAGSPGPAAPVLFWAAHAAASGLVVSPLGSSGKVAVRNNSSRPVTVTLAASGYWLSTARTVSSITPKPTTTMFASGDVTAVSGDPAATQTVTLASGAPVPSVGHVVTAPPSTADPDGLLGTVTAVTAGPDGATVVTLTPATLDQAYSTFDVSTSHTVTSSDVVQAPGSQAGQTQSTGAALMPGQAARTTARSAQARDLAQQAAGTGYNLSESAFTCTGSGAGPAISLTADLSKMSVDLSLNANPTAPNIGFLVTADPVFDVNVGFTGTVTCKLSAAHFLEIQVPVPAAPGLVVDIYPVVTLSAGGQASIDFQWAPRAAVGFVRGPGISSEVHAFGSSGNVKISATAGAELFLGYEADVKLGGRIGVGGDLGPDLNAEYDASTTCVTVDGATEVGLSASADVFVKNWTFALATGKFGERQLYRKCGAAASSGPSSTPTSPSAPPPASSPPADSTWTAAQPPLPADADNTGDSEIIDVSCPSSTSCLASGQYADTSGVERGMLLSWSNGTWTAAQAGPYIFALSCPTASYCVSVGVSNVYTWSGGTWTTTQVPAPADISSSHLLDLQGVSCVSESACVAVGSYTNTAGSQEGVLETLSDGTWIPERAPLPADAAANPDVTFGTGLANLVSCGSASFCVAAGDYTNASGQTAGLLEILSDGTWTVNQVPSPADAVTGSQANLYLTGISCLTAAFCVADGGYTGTSGSGKGLVETWSGGSWSQTTLPGSGGTNPGPVACISTSACIIAGSSGSEVLTSSGRSWTAAPFPGPPYGTIWNIANLSCASTSYCFAVGNSQQASPDVWHAAMATGPA